MSFQGRIFNELGTGEISVWSNLSPGISPAQWANLCRKISRLSPKEFLAIVALVNGHECLKNAVTRHVEGVLGINAGHEGCLDGEAKGKQFSF